MLILIAQTGSGYRVRYMINESMVSLVSRRYMRGETRTESLVV